MLWGQWSTWGHLGYPISGQGSCRFNDTASSSSFFLPCPHSGAGFYILSVSASSSYPARIAGQGLVLHQFLLSSSSSSFCQHVNISYMLHSILTKLGLSDQYLDRYSHTNNDGVRGHDGVTGVKKVIFTKIAIFRTDYLVWSCDSYIFIN